MSFELTAIYALNWTPKLLKFINLIKGNPVIYALDKSAKNKMLRRKEKEAWRDICKSMVWGLWRCKKKWEKIRNQYGKLKCLIDSGRLPLELFKEYAVIKKYFNGSLSFLDPHLGDLSNPKKLKCFPTSKKFDNAVQKLCQVSCEQVCKYLKKDKENKLSDAENLNGEDNKYVTSIISAGIKQSLNALFFVEQTEDIQYIETENDEMNNTEVVENKEANNIETCDGTIYYNQISSDREYSGGINWNDVTDSLMETKESGTLKNSSDDLIKIEINEINTKSLIENDSTKLVKNTESGVSDAQMRQFFKELGYAMSQELSLDKQVKLQKEINTLIKRTILNKPR